MIVSHMMYDFRTWLIVGVMGLAHMIHFGYMTYFTSYDWFRYVAQLTHTSQLMDFTP